MVFSQTGVGQMADNFAALEERVKRDRLEEAGTKRLRESRASLVLGQDYTHAFFAALALKLLLEIDWSIDTCSTDGTYLRYNPEFMSQLTLEEALFVNAHEVLHLAQKHHSRRMGRDWELWNKACDLAINWILVKAGIGKPPKGALIPGYGDYAHLPGDLSAETYYEKLLEEQQKQEQQQEQEQEQDQQPGEGEGEGEGEADGGGEGKSDPGGCGTFQAPGDGSQSAVHECDQQWTDLVAQADQIAKQRGTAPGSLSDLVTNLLTPKADWREQLRDFICRRANNDFNWQKPSRRFMWMDPPIFLPSLENEELGDIVALVDSSGSCWDQRILQRFASELNGILDSFPGTKLTIIYHDIPVHQVEEWDQNKGPLVLTPKGGGGTSHIPAFKHIEDNQLDPVCVIALTDLATEFPMSPAYPVLWACVQRGGAAAPFGTVIDVE
jgi:predicted metal-dependent peptidase